MKYEINYFERPTQLLIEEELKNGMITQYGAIGFGASIICGDNGFVHPVNAVGDYITILKVFPWVNISDEIIGN